MLDDFSVKMNEFVVILLIVENIFYMFVTQKIR